MFHIYKLYTAGIVKIPKEQKIHISFHPLSTNYTMAIYQKYFTSDGKTSNIGNMFLLFGRQEFYELSISDNFD